MAFVRDGASGGTSNNNNKRTTTTTPTSPMNIGIPTQNKSVAKTTSTTPMNTGVTTPTSSKSSVGSSNNSTLKTSTNTGKTPTSISDLKYLDTVASQDFTNYLNNLNNGGGNGSDYGSGVGAITANTSYYDDLMKAFMEQNDAARQSMIDAIMSNLNAVKGTYKNQINSIVDQYQGLINENEVNRERTRRRIRENQANRGQLDSGLGRQERLDLDTTYDSQNSQLKSAREQAVNEIMNLIAQAEAEANTNKANVESNYNNALLQYKLANS